MSLHPPKKERWATPVIREERRRVAPARKTTGFTLGSLFGDAIKADRAAKERRCELNDMGFRPINIPEA